LLFVVRSYMLNIIFGVCTIYVSSMCSYLHIKFSFYTWNLVTLLEVEGFKATYYSGIGWASFSIIFEVSLGTYQFRLLITLLDSSYFSTSFYSSYKLALYFGFMTKVPYKNSLKKSKILWLPYLKIPQIYWSMYSWFERLLF